MSNYNTTLQSNNTDLQAILNTINELPSATVQPNGTLSITENGNYNVKNYVYADVNVTQNNESCKGNI